MAQRADRVGSADDGAVSVGLVGLPDVGQGLGVAEHRQSFLQLGGWVLTKECPVPSTRQIP